MVGTWWHPGRVKLPQTSKKTYRKQKEYKNLASSQKLRNLATLNERKKKKEKKRNKNKPPLIEICLRSKMVLKQEGVGSVSHYSAVTSDMKYVT